MPQALGVNCPVLLLIPVPALASSIFSVLRATCRAATLPDVFALALTATADFASFAAALAATAAAAGTGN